MPHKHIADVRDGLPLANLYLEDVLPIARVVEVGVGAGTVLGLLAVGVAAVVLTQSGKP